MVTWVTFLAILSFDFFYFSLKFDFFYNLDLILDFSIQFYPIYKIYKSHKWLIFAAKKRGIIEMGDWIKLKYLCAQKII